MWWSWNTISVHYKVHAWGSGLSSTCLQEVSALRRLSWRQQLLPLAWQRRRWLWCHEYIETPFLSPKALLETISGDKIPCAKPSNRKTGNKVWSDKPLWDPSNLRGIPTLVDAVQRWHCIWEEGIKQRVCQGHLQIEFILVIVDPAFFLPCQLRHKHRVHCILLFADVPFVDESSCWAVSPTWTFAEIKQTADCPLNQGSKAVDCCGWGTALEKLVGAVLGLLPYWCISLMEREWFP